MKLSVVIPLYGEEENVIELTTRLIKSIDCTYEIIYVIDGPDAAVTKLESLNNDNIKINYSPVKRGYKNSLVAGFYQARGDYILTMDGDLNHQPEEINSFFKVLKWVNADMVIGSRYVIGGEMPDLALWRKCVSMGANFIIATLFKVYMKDKTSGYRLYKRKSLMSIVPSLTTSNFEVLFEILYLFERKKYLVCETPITFIARKHGKSKFEFVKLAKGYFKMLRYVWR